MNTPIVRLEIENMKHTILVALHEYTDRMDADIQQAIDIACSPENIRRTIENEVQRQVGVILREEITRFYQYGPGRETIRGLVENILTQPDRDKEGNKAK